MILESGYAHLLSGTDIRGIAVDTETKQRELTEEIGMNAGAGFVRFLQRKTGKRAEEILIAIGCDSRVTAQPLSLAMIRGIRSMGAQVVDCGLCTTPAMFMTTKLSKCSAAVMVTASHMPWQYNGYKFLTAEGGLSSEDVARILEDAHQYPAKEGNENTMVMNFLDTYQGYLKNKVITWLGQEKPLKGLHIVVDAGNGAGGFYADLLSSLGTCTEGSQFLNPDGYFPNHIPNPEAKEAIDMLSAAVLRERADLGIIFDADCDRAALVDEKGRAINRNRLIALTAAMLLMEVKPITVVTDSVVSAGLSDFIAEKGGTMRRFKRGYHNVIEEAKRLCGMEVDCRLAMETSGHAAFHENYFLDDGMYLATRLIVLAKRMQLNGQKLCDLIIGLREPLESGEYRLMLTATDIRRAGESIIKSVERATIPGWTVDPENHEGVRVLCGSDENWFLLRPSLHDPILVLNVETAEKGGLVQILHQLRELLSEYSSLDCQAIDTRLEMERSHLQ